MFKFYFKKKEWEEISELEFHAKLYMHVKQTTPIIKYLLKDEENIYVNSGLEFKIKKG